MRLLLINPPHTGGVRSLFMIHQSKAGIGHKPPLSLLYLASAVLQQGEWEVKILDAPTDNLTEADLIDQIELYQPDVVGITVWTEFWYGVHSLVKEIKARFLDIFVVLGGAHVNIYQNLILKYSDADAIVLGDGEVPLLFLLQHIARTPHLQQIDHASIILRAEAETKKGAIFVQTNLDQLPFPDRTLLEIKKYYSILGQNSFTTTMITSRGCPHHCVFCKMHYQKVLARSAENIVQELQEIQRLGIQEVEIYDDTFTWSKQRVLDICNKIIEKKINLKWAIRDRVSNVDPELLAIMKQAGCYRVHYGVESGDAAILKVIQKGITTQQAERAIKLAKSFGLTTLTYFMFGLPTETKVEVAKSIAFALELDSDYCEFSIAVPYPGTRMYDEALRLGIIPRDFWLEYLQHPTRDFTIPYVYEEHLRLPELIAWRNLAARKFYFRPRYIAREILKTRHPQEFKRKLGMACSLVKMNLGLAKS